MENVKELLVLVPIQMVIGGRVSVTRAGKVKIAVSSWSLIAMMDMTMIKVGKSIFFGIS